MARVEFDTSHVKEFFASLFGRFRKSAQDVIEETMTGIRDEMREPGLPVTYPIEWDSEKQRRFVMAKLKRENNLPYKRTNAYVNGWALTTLPNGMALSNSHPAGAIGGTLSSRGSSQALGGSSFQSWQSRIHRGRWKSILVVALQAIADMPKRVIDKIKAVS